MYRKILPLFLFAAGLFAQGSFFLKSGDTVVFYGDSITDQRLYTTFAETYAVTRFPNLDLKFVHSGWGGDRVNGGGGGPVDVRLNRDVYPYKPTVMTIMLGMNDGRYRAFDQDLFDAYSAGIKSIVKNVKSTVPGIRITLIEPSPYDDVTRPPLFSDGYNAVLVRYGKFLRDFARAENLGIADLNSSVVEELAKANAIDPEGARKMLPDRVHPGPGGHLLMAKALLKAWNAPATVTIVEIDIASGIAARSENTNVSGLKIDGVVSWDQMDKALPMPLDMRDAGIALAVRSSDVMQSLNQELLRLNSLPASRYRLRIDGEDVGVFSREQLSDGINLAALPATPMLKQAAEVHAITLRHNNIHFVRWRQIQVPLEPTLAHRQAAMDAMDALDSDLRQQQHTTAQPKPHHYEMLPEAN
ncbi:MAG: SGNH/GDSL hydrolase family protein [Bryobacteraceae bacterium]